MSSNRSESLDDDIGVEESDSFLENGKSSRHTMTSQRKSFFARYHRFFLLQVGLICIYSFVFFLLQRHTTIAAIPTSQMVYSPARDAVQFEKVRFNATLIIDSPYNGAPSPEVDKAWSDLLENMNIAVPGSDLRQIGASSIAVPGREDTYIAGLSVYHELHCLKRIRQFTWPEYYYGDLNAEETRLNRLHADHCIDVLRQAILCRADISLFTLEWSTAEPMPRADFSHEHTCVNWQAVFEWAGKRRLSEDVLKNLKHPKYGAAFPNGEGSRLGASEDHSPGIQGI